MRLSHHRAAVAALLLGAGPAAAHGLGERYDLPLPLGLYLSGAALVVALSFLVLAAFARAGPKAAGHAPIQTPSLSVPPLPGSRFLIVSARGLSAALFILLMIAGFFGSPDPFKNPLPVIVWIIGWVGIAYFSALVGNVWALINPWDNFFRLAEWIASRAGRSPRPLMPYPQILGAWPALALFLGFAWMELVWPDRDHPVALAWAVLIYSALTWSGMAVFGRRTWLQNGEAFAVAFGLLARFAVIVHAEDRKKDSIAFRPPAIGLLVRSPVAPSIAAFALLMLATVTFDGLLETPLWAAISERALLTAFLQRAGEVSGIQPDLLLTTTALICFPVIFIAIYLLVARLMVMTLVAGEKSVSTSEMARLFVLTIVPIAIGYHLSHYLSYLLIAGQFIIPIASDPFALGWNLFGTRLYLIDLSVIDARLVWYASVTLIVAGHVIAVWLAHAQAMRIFADRSMVLRSQIPMLALMVGYTAVSLWILAQPITEAGR